MRILFKNRREYSHLKEREGRSLVSRWEMNRLRTRDSLLAISIVRLFECILNEINNCLGTSCETFLFFEFVNSFQ